MKKNKVGLSNFITLIDNDFVIKQTLTPIGKIVHATIASGQTMNSAQAVFQGEMNLRMRLNMLQQKCLETISQPEENLQYSRELRKLEKKIENKKTPNFGKLKKITVRVVGYNKNGHSIVEPAHKSDENLLLRIGYTQD